MISHWWVNIFAWQSECSEYHALTDDRNQNKQDLKVFVSLNFRRFQDSNSHFLKSYKSVCTQKKPVFISIYKPVYNPNIPLCRINDTALFFAPTVKDRTLKINWTLKTAGFWILLKILNFWTGTPEVN